MELLKAELASPTNATLAPQAEASLLAALWDNQAFRKYCDLREDYLIKQGMEQFMAGRLTQAHGLSGQLVEVRQLRSRAKNAWTVIHSPQRGKPSRPDASAQLDAGTRPDNVITS